MNPGTGARLLHGVAGHVTSLREHERTFGPLPVHGDVVGLLHAAGLRGRGGAAFPTHRKVQLLRDDRARRKYVVVNAMEGEPAAHKDQALLGINPHLVLDGAQTLARTIGAHEIAVCVAREKVATINVVERAIHERVRRENYAHVELHTPPGRYIAGEESALVHWLDDNETLPQYRPHKPSVLRIGRGPVLVDNAETHANVALIARQGPEWFREAGTAEHPGTTLVSVSGAVPRPVVLEVPLGIPLHRVLSLAGVTAPPQALLLGGYGGSWIAGHHLDVTYDNEALAPLGASVGAGVIIVLPAEGCGVTETHNIARWMAHESARQCGPCAFGLPALAESLGALCRPGREQESALRALRERLVLIPGRGACRHPDGVVRLIQSALRVFHDDVTQHAAGRACAHNGRSHFATVPRLALEHELEWE